MLRALDKENITPAIQQSRSATKFRASIKGFDGVQVPQKELKQVGEVTADRINFQVFEAQLKKLTEACETQRKEKWIHAQAKNRLQNQVRVLQVEKENQGSENKKLRTELNDLISKMNDVQSKANKQTSEFYALKNENTALQIELKKYQDCDKKWSEKWQQLKATKNEIEIDISKLQSELAEWKNESKLKETEIDLLRRTIFELEAENKNLSENTQVTSQISDQKFKQICQELENWKSAFEKKEQELESKSVVLQEENNLMKRTIGQFSNQMLQTKSSFQRSMSLPIEIPERNNEFHVRLFVKETQIEKLNQSIKQLEQKVQTLEVQNALLSKKCTEGTVFSPMGYQRYNQIQNSIMKNSDLKRQTRDLKILVESKEKEIECLVEKINEAGLQMESVVIENKKLQSEFEQERITFENVVNELNYTKTKLERELELLKSKVEGLRKDCEEKDRIIMNYVNRQKQ